MPVAASNLRPRLPQAPFPLTNGTATATQRSLTTSRNVPAASRADETKQASGTQAPMQTPSSIPAPSYVSISVAPIGALPPVTTSQSSVPPYSGSNAAILNGYCTEPGYTILDGPSTALWVPVVGCISSKADCCPLPTAVRDNATPAQSQSGNNNKRPGSGSGESAVAAFPISSLPSQGEIKGCPKDYHTVTAASGVACCPTSYWLWSTQIGGQIPCYSSLDKAMVPPPIPETLAFNYMGSMTKAESTTTGDHPLRISGSITAAPFPRPTAPLDLQKPTSAIVNIAYAMQYKLAADDEPGLKKEAKIGIGVGAAAGGVLILAFIAVLICRGCTKRKRTKAGGYEETSPSERFGSQIDMSLVAHEPAGVARTHGGIKYAGFRRGPVEYRD